MEKYKIDIEIKRLKEFKKIESECEMKSIYDFLKFDRLTYEIREEIRQCVVKEISSFYDKIRSENPDLAIDRDSYGMHDREIKPRHYKYNYTSTWKFHEPLDLEKQGFFPRYKRGECLFEYEVNIDLV